MIKKQQKWVALFVTLTFIWLLQVSTMPVAAAGSAEQNSSISQGQNYYEVVGPKTAPAKKKSILPWILIGVGVITLTAVVLILILSSGYDITGTWTLSYTWSGDQTGVSTLTFTGNKKNGTFVTSNNSGTYTVDGKNVTFTFAAHGAVYTGTFSNKKSMSGTMVSGGNYYSGTWTATKTAGAAASVSPTTSHVAGCLDEAGKRIQ